MLAISFCRSAAQAARPTGDHLRLVVILSRHGVRSPTWTQERLDSYSVQPWPQWSVPPGDLTARGADFLTLFGAYDRASLAKEGLWPAQGCDAAASSYIWADTDQRTLASGKALAEGLFPGCSAAVHSLPPGQNDPLFHPPVNGLKPAELDAILAQFGSRIEPDSAAHAGTRAALVAELQQVLLGCKPTGLCGQAKTPLPTAPAASVRGKGGHIVDVDGPLPTASTLAEDLLLEYADGMKTSDVGWGRVDEPELRRLLGLHTDYFSLMHRTPKLAQIEASNILSHILRTLEQGAAGHPVSQSIGPQGSRLVVLMGHDTNLAGVAELLGLHWHLDGRDDDTVPGTELSFELWQDVHGTDSVRVVVSAQTLPQLREMKPVSLAAPPARQTIMPAACAAGRRDCTLDEFRTVADRAIDSSHVLTQP